MRLTKVAVSLSFVSFSAVVAGDTFGSFADVLVVAETQKCVLLLIRHLFILEVGQGE